MDIHGDPMGQQLIGLFGVKVLTSWKFLVSHVKRSKVEASPRTCATLRRRVAELHQDHRIRSRNVAVAPFSGEAAFYVVSERFQQEPGALCLNASGQCVVCIHLCIQQSIHLWILIYPYIIYIDS